LPRRFSFFFSFFFVEQSFLTPSYSRARMNYEDYNKRFGGKVCKEQNRTEKKRKEKKRKERKELACEHVALCTQSTQEDICPK
jgi:hypothetical protein